MFKRPFREFAASLSAGAMGGNGQPTCGGPTDRRQNWNPSKISKLLQLVVPVSVANLSYVQSSICQLLITRTLAPLPSASSVVFQILNSVLASVCMCFPESSICTGDACYGHDLLFGARLKAASSYI